MADSPSSENTYRVPSPTDTTLIGFLEKLAQLTEGARFKIQLVGREVGNYRVAAEFTGQYPDGRWDESRRITQAEVNGLEIARVKFRRAVTTFDPNPRTEPSNWENEISVLWHPPHGQPSTEILLAIVEAIDELRQAVRPLAAAGGGQETLAVFAQQLSGLTDLHNKIVRDAEAARLKREAEFDARRDNQVKELDQQRKQLLAEVKDDRDRLAAERTALEERADALDDRSHMHARRDLRVRITEDLKERLKRAGVSQSVGLTRAAIFGGGAILMVILGWVVVQSGLQLNEAIQMHMTQPAELMSGSTVRDHTPAERDSLVWVFVGRISVAATVLAGLGFYLLGWARQLHDNDLRNERELERYRYDLDRASWAIETILEAQDKEQGRLTDVVPDAWIAGATHGLFARSAPRDGEHTAMEALGSLLNFAAEAEFGPQGPKFKLTKRGITQLKRKGLVVSEEDA